MIFNWSARLRNFLVYVLVPSAKAIVSHMWPPLKSLYLPIFPSQIILAFEKFFWFTIEYNDLLFAYTLIIIEFVEWLKDLFPGHLSFLCYKQHFCKFPFILFPIISGFCNTEISCIKSALVKRHYVSFGGHSLSSHNSILILCKSLFLETHTLLQDRYHPWHQYDVKVHGALSVSAHAHAHLLCASKLNNTDEIFQGAYSFYTVQCRVHHVKTVTRVRVPSPQSLKICLEQALTPSAL